MSDGDLRPEDIVADQAAGDSSNGFRIHDQDLDRELEELVDGDIARQLSLTLRALEDVDMRLTAVQLELIVCGLALLLAALGAWKAARQ